MPQQSSCSLISPAGLVNSHLIRMQIALIRLIYQDLFFLWPRHKTGRKWSDPKKLSWGSEMSIRPNVTYRILKWESRRCKAKSKKWKNLKRKRGTTRQKQTVVSQQEAKGQIPTSLMIRGHKNVEKSIKTKMEPLGRVCLFSSVSVCLHICVSVLVGGFKVWFVSALCRISQYCFFFPSHEINPHQAS